MLIGHATHREALDSPFFTRMKNSVSMIPSLKENRPGRSLDLGCGVRSLRSFH